MAPGAPVIDLDAEAVRRVLLQSRRGPLKPKEIAKGLDLPDRHYPQLKRLLRTMERDGALYRIRGKRYAVPASIDLVVGTLDVTRAGHAYLLTGAGTEDILVQERALEGAMDGDRVAVRVEGRLRGRRYGRVMRVLERAHSVIVGTYHSARKHGGTVRPADRALGQDLLIPREEAGAAAEGDLVRVEVIAYGSKRTSPVGRVVEVLGQPDTPGVDVLAILHGHGLEPVLPPEVEADALRAIEEGETRPEADRIDRLDLHVFTIDPADARDHDDALSVQDLGDGRVRVGIHIADVAHFVEQGSILDLEALRRGTSTYLVDRVLPMLPESLSAGVCSISADEPRRVVSVFIDFDAEGQISAEAYERSWIRSRHSLTYEEAQAALDGSAAIDPPTDAALQRLAQLAGVLRKRRKLRGSIDFDIPEARVILGPDGAPTRIERRSREESHRLVEDFMLLANESLAKKAARKDWPFLYRVHHAPELDRLESLKALLDGLGHRLPHKVRPKHLQRVLQEVEGKPEQPLVSNSILRAMMRAQYAATNDGHYGLAAEHYTHFTSPIRRYPDLHVHRVLAHRQFGVDAETADWSVEAIKTLAEHVSRRERVAEQAERDSVALKKIEYMERHLGDEFPARISGVTSFGLFVIPDEVFVEGLVHVSSLGDDYYHFHERELALVGEKRGRIFRIGDALRVTVARLDRGERKVDYVLA